jgi:hypothetical protein
MTEIIYVIIGETEEVAQREVGGNFESFYTKEVVGYVDSVEKAEDFIKHSRLKTPQRGSFSGTKNYRGGYFSMDYEVATKL